MINKPPPFKGLHIRVPIIIPIKGRGYINHGSTLNPYPKGRPDSLSGEVSRTSGFRHLMGQGFRVEGLGV